MWVIAYETAYKGWCIINLYNHHEVMAGPYSTHAEAVEAAETMAHRVAQGWKP